MIHPLDRKLLRDLGRMKGQVLAVCLVMACGLAMMIMTRSLIVSLNTARGDYYERHRFADVFSSLKRAPKSVAAEIAARSFFDLDTLQYRRPYQPVFISGDYHYLMPNEKLPYVPGGPVALGYHEGPFGFYYDAATPPPRSLRSARTRPMTRCRLPPAPPTCSTCLPTTAHR